MPPSSRKTMPLTALSLMKRWASKQTCRPVVPQTRPGVPGAARLWEVVDMAGCGYSTKILPVMLEWPMPQNSLQTMVNSPFEVGVRVSTWS